MKKVLRILFLQLIIMVLVVGHVKADSDPCKISLNSSTKNLKAGDEVTLNITMSSITLASGIKVFIGFIDYNDEVFEFEFDDSDEALDEIAKFTEATEYEPDSVAALYIGSQDEQISNNPWNAMAICDDDGVVKGIVAYSSEAEKNTQAIAKIKLAVDEYAESSTETIVLSEIKVSTDAEDEYQVTDKASITYTIEGASDDDDDDDDDDDWDDDDDDDNDDDDGGTSVGSTGSGSSTGNKNTNKNNNANNNKNGNSAGNKAPDTGLDDYIFVISIVLLIGFISFIEYRKYKDINID